MNAIKTTAIALCAATRLVSSAPALANDMDADMAGLVAAVAVYHLKCGELPNRLLQTMARATVGIPKATMDNQILLVLNMYQSNPIAFCEKAKPAINKGLGALGSN